MGAVCDITGGREVVGGLLNGRWLSESVTMVAVTPLEAREGWLGAPCTELLIGRLGVLTESIKGGQLGSALLRVVETGVSGSGREEFTENQLCPLVGSAGGIPALCGLCTSMSAGRSCPICARGVLSLRTGIILHCVVNESERRGPKSPKVVIPMLVLLGAALNEGIVLYPRDFGSERGPADIWNLFSS